MANKFIDNSRRTLPDENGATKKLRSELKATWKFLSFSDVGGAKDSLKASYDHLDKLDRRINAYKGEVPTELRKAYDAAAIRFNNDVTRLGYSQSKLGASVKNMFKSFAEALGSNTTTEKWSSSVIKGTPKEAWERAAKIEGNIVERILSKPFRVMGNNPRIALLGVGALGAIGIGDVMHKRAELHTQEDAMRQAAEIDAQMRLAQMQQVPMAQANTLHVPQADQSPAAMMAANPPSVVMAGNDNLQYQGTLSTQRQQGVAGL